MKTKIISLLCLALMGGLTTPSARADSMSTAADALVVRPVCFAATLVGSAIFVIALPFAAVSKSVKKTASTLVEAPARATFTRPIGDFSGMAD